MKAVFVITLALSLVGGLSCGGESTSDEAQCLGKCDTASTEGGEAFEFIVVGSGAGGGPLAANLARAGFRVPLLEAGDYTGGSQTYEIPALHPQASEDHTLSWSYFVDHYDDERQALRDSKMVYEEGGERAARGILYPRGSTLGGSTANNAMITVYPHESDWDQLAELTGDSSWSARNMRQYFVNLERNRYLRSSDRMSGHGFDGWLPTEEPNVRLGLADVQLGKLVVASALTFVGETERGVFRTLWGDARELVGFIRRDMNAPGAERDQREGLFMIPTSTERGVRSGVREYILSTISEGHPLTVRTRSLVTNVVFADAADGSPRAIGVDYLEGRNLFRAHVDAEQYHDTGLPGRALASREVILSAGAFNTPQLLMLSGIGPRAHLQEHGIPVRVDSPGVGHNLQDRYEVGVTVRAENGFSMLERCAWTFQEGDRCLADWRQGEGMYTSNGGTVAIVRRSSVAEEDPDLFIFGVPGFFKGYYPGYSMDVMERRDLFTWVILKGHSENTAGTVTLRSSDPRDPPSIQFRYFDDASDQRDLAAVTEGVEFVRNMMDTANDLSLFHGFEEVWPGSDVNGRDEITQFIRDEAWGHHASCTAPIGADDDPMAVLDSEFRVRGVQGLRVVDASVFPRIPGFFPVVPIYMVSEKASEVLIREYRD